jgi:uncharacterized repeat protein (TIGR03803 family)
MRYSRLSVRGAAFLVSVSLLCGAATAQDDLRVLYHFGYGNDGHYPDTDLVPDAAGTLYGMTVQGGFWNSGTVFRFQPEPVGWTLWTIYEFTSGPDGGQPYGGVTLDTAGNIYGTAVVGGDWTGCPEDGCGVVWRLQPDGLGGWVQDVIHAFQNIDGYGPGGPLSFDAQGNLYGMTPGGGGFGMGTVFQLRPTPTGPWQHRVIHHFTGGEDGGGGSKARLLIEPDGTMYGVATTGGAYGLGTAFRMAPVPGTGWEYEVLHAFRGIPDGIFPYGGLIKDAQGNLYGTTYYGGVDDLGTVYRLSQVGGTWTSTVLHDFAGGNDGAYPISALAFGTNGAMYGTTSLGGVSGDGTVFKMTKNAAGVWRTKVVYAFDGSDGELPYSGLIMDPVTQDLFGTAVHGGENGDGTIYRFSP